MDCQLYHCLHLIHFEEASAGVSWVKLNSFEISFVVLHVISNAYVDVFDVSNSGGDVIYLVDDHVAAITAASLDIATASCVVLKGRHSLEKLFPNWPKRVL